MKNEPTSKKSARLSMIEEVVEFMENSLPELIGSLIGIIGVVVLIASLNMQVFLWSLAATFLVFFIFYLSRNRTIRFNSGYNDEIEQQVNTIDAEDKALLDTHLKKLMTWNVKLSDLEALNFSLSWMILISFLVTSIILGAGDANITYGALFSLVMYVFQYNESVTALPFYYQTWLRLSEIRQRLEEIEA